MSEYARVDVDAARDFLSQRYSNRAAGVAELGRGDWATAYGFMLDGAACVARFAAQCDDFKKDRIAASYGVPGLPIPRIIGIGDAPGGFFAISERAYGDHLDALDTVGIRAATPEPLRRA